MARTLIRADDACRDLIISGNWLNAKGVSVSAGAGAKGIDVRDNRYSNPQVRPPGTAERVKASKKEGVRP